MSSKLFPALLFVVVAAQARGAMKLRCKTEPDRYSEDFIRMQCPDYRLVGKFSSAGGGACVRSGDEFYVRCFGSFRGTWLSPLVGADFPDCPSDSIFFQMPNNCPSILADSDDCGYLRSLTCDPTDPQVGNVIRQFCAGFKTDLHLGDLSCSWTRTAPNPPPVAEAECCSRVVFKYEPPDPTPSAGVGAVPPPSVTVTVTAVPSGTSPTPLETPAPPTLTPVATATPVPPPATPPTSWWPTWR